MGKGEQDLPSPFVNYTFDSNDRHGTTIDWYAPDGSRWLIDVQFDDIGGRAECEYMTLRAPMSSSADGTKERRPITAEVWRRVPVGALIDQARAEILKDADGMERYVAERLATTAEWPDDSPRVESEAIHHKWQVKRDFYAATIAGDRARKLVGKNGEVLSPEAALAEVAAIYREAWRAGLNPTKVVAEALSLSRSAAAKRVRRARDAGLLPQTTRGRATAAGEEGGDGGGLSARP